MPVEPLMKLVKPPTGTKGVSKLPLTMSFARAADAAKTRIKIVKRIFQIRMPRNAFAERGQTGVGRSELLATCSIIGFSVYQILDWTSDLRIIRFS
jgi:hypothetical protein